MKNILIVPPGTIDKRQKLRLQTQGVTTIEIEDPSKVRLLTPELEIPSNDFTIALLEGILSGGLSSQATFVKDLLDRLKANNIKK
jgi:hypothetical protein